MLFIGTLLTPAGDEQPPHIRHPATEGTERAGNQARSLNTKLFLPSWNNLRIFLCYQGHKINLRVNNLLFFPFSLQGDPSPEVILRDLDPQSKILCGLEGKASSSSNAQWVCYLPQSDRNAFLESTLNGPRSLFFVKPCFRNTCVVKFQYHMNDKGCWVRSLFSYLQSQAP